MIQAKLKPAYSLSILIAIIAILSSIGGLFISDLYRDSAFVASMWKWNDIVTLFVAVPLLIISMIASRRGSKRARLIWIAMLNYMLYNYAFYLFGAAFNKLFLLYASLVTLSIFALIFGLINIEAKEIGQLFRRGKFYRWISAYMIFTALGLSVVYIIQSLDFAITGQIPEIVQKTGHPTSVVFALDFSLLIPVFLLGAIWLWKGKAWGYVLASISMVKGTTYTLVLAVVSIFASQSESSGSSSEWPFWSGLTILSFISGLYLLKKLTATQN